MLKRLKTTLLALACVLPLSASALVQQHPLQSPATSLASAYDTTESIFPNAPSDTHETLVIIGYSDGSVLAYRCRNNPMEGYDALGLDYIKKEFIYENTLSGRQWTGRYRIYWVVQKFPLDPGRKFPIGEAEHELGIGPQEVELYGGGSVAFRALEDRATGKDRGYWSTAGLLKDPTDDEACAWIDERLKNLQKGICTLPVSRVSLDPNLITTLNYGTPHDPASPLAKVEEGQAAITAEMLQAAITARVLSAWRPVAAESEIFETGVNITPRSVANKYRIIGRGGRTFVTDRKAVESIIGPLRGNRIVISAQKARQLENALGLNPSSLEARNIISVVDNIPGRAPGSPISGNSLFQGGGAGLPGGAAELTIQGIPSAGGQGIGQIILEVIN